MKRLVIFDIDGTLTTTMTLDTEVFFAAVREILDIEQIDTDWSTYRDVTDVGVTTELIERRHGRPADPHEIDAVRRRFVALLDEAIALHPEQCRPVAGAAEILAVLRTHADFRCAIATGAWRESALIKIHCAGLAIDGLPLTTTEDAPQREVILEIAADRARALYELPEATECVLVGDGVWDVRAARRVGFAFIGVGAGEEARKLSAAGASLVIGDYTDVDQVLTLLRTAPARPARPVP